MTAAIITGGCLCGAIRYEFAGTPFDITHCHCADCRRNSGAAFVTWASVRRAEFRYTKGEPRVLRWAARVRAFCKDCGTPLTFRDHDGADVVDVTVCSFDQPESVTPADHTWTEDRLAWVKLADGLPEYARARVKDGG